MFLWSPLTAMCAFSHEYVILPNKTEQQSGIDADRTAFSTFFTPLCRVGLNATDLN